jgi:hypothetical protein
MKAFRISKKSAYQYILNLKLFLKIQSLLSQILLPEEALAKGGNSDKNCDIISRLIPIITE